MFKQQKLMGDYRAETNVFCKGNYTHQLMGFRNFIG